MVSNVDFGPLTLTVGCTFGFETPQAISAVLQVAPTKQDQKVLSERWEIDADHHGYVDLFGNRCERVTIEAGMSRIVYEAEVSLSSPVDRIAHGTAETPIMELSDEHLTYLMPSRFCLPDELGHEAWLRFGDLAPGRDRVQAIVDYVHDQHILSLSRTCDTGYAAVDVAEVDMQYLPRSNGQPVAWLLIGRVEQARLRVRPSFPQLLANCVKART
jgi:hypothetical protein